MTAEMKRRLVMIYECVFVVLLALVAIATMLSCYLIYISGENPFTRESIAAQFSYIAPIVYPFLLVLLAGFVLKVLVPPPVRTVRGRVPSRIVCERLRKRVDLSALDADACGVLCREKKLRRTLAVLTAVSLAVGAFVGLVFVLLPKNHAGLDPNAEVLRAFLVGALSLLPCAVLTFLCYVLFEGSYKREIAVLGRAPKGTGGESEEDSAPRPDVLSRVGDLVRRHRDRLLLWARVGAVALGILFVVLGCVNGGALAVLEKAVTICSECIGLA